MLDDFYPGDWYEWVSTDETIIAPFLMFRYDSMARARKGFYFVVMMAGERKRLIWSGHLRRVIPA